MVCLGTECTIWGHADTSYFTGKPYQHALAVDVGGSARTLRYYGGWADKIQGDTIETTPNKLVYTIREPVGVCGQIIPCVQPRPTTTSYFTNDLK